MSKNTSSNVNIVDGKLILSLPDAQMPVVWQMDLEQAQSSAFTVQENKKEKNFTLVLKTQDGTVDTIAAFDDKESAVDTLMETSSVLQNAHGQIKGTVAANSNAVSVSSGSDNKSDKMGALLALALIFVLGLIWMISASSGVGTGQPGATTAASLSSASDVSARESSGVPVSADDFLSNR